MLRDNPGPPAVTEMAQKAFVLSSRLEFEVADFDGLGPRAAVLKHPVGPNKWLVAVTPPIVTAWGRVSDCVVVPRHLASNFGVIVARWLSNDLDPPSSDAARLAETVLVHVLMPPVGEGSWPQPVDIQRAGMRTWGEAAPSERFLFEHRAHADPTGVFDADALAAIVELVAAHASDGDSWTPMEEWEDEGSNLRKPLSVLASAYIHAKRTAGRATSDLSPDLVGRLESIKGWLGFVESFYPAEADPRVTAIADFARREGHLRNLQGVFAGGLELEPALRQIMFLYLTGTGLHPNDVAALRSLGDVWKEAFRDRRP